MDGLVSADVTLAAAEGLFLMCVSVGVGVGVYG